MPLIFPFLSFQKQKPNFPVPATNINSPNFPKKNSQSHNRSLAPVEVGIGFRIDASASDYCAGARVRDYLNYAPRKLSTMWRTFDILALERRCVHECPRGTRKSKIVCFAKDCWWDLFDGAACGIYRRKIRLWFELQSFTSHQ